MNKKRKIMLVTAAAIVSVLAIPIVTVSVVRMYTSWVSTKSQYDTIIHDQDNDKVTNDVVSDDFVFVYMSPSNLPDGYAPDPEQGSHKTYTHTEQYNGPDGVINFRQSLSGSVSTIDNAHGDYTLLDINGYDGYYYDRDDKEVLLNWSDGTYTYTLTVSPALKDKIMDLALSVSPES